MTDSDRISPETFAHLVELAALRLTPQEAEYLLEQLNNQLKAIHELEAIPLDESLPASAHGVAYTQAISQPPREDAWQPFANLEALLNQTPQLEDRYIIVPEIPHTDLE